LASLACEPVVAEVTPLVEPDLLLEVFPLLDLLAVLDLLPVELCESVLDDVLDLLLDVDALLPVDELVSSVVFLPITALPTVLPASSRAFLVELPASSRAFPASSNGSSFPDDTWALAVKAGAIARLTMAKPTSAASIRYLTFVESMCVQDIYKKN
jgi:hypothetical protein